MVGQRGDGSLSAWMHLVPGQAGKAQMGRELTVAEISLTRIPLPRSGKSSLFTAMHLISCKCCVSHELTVSQLKPVWLLASCSGICQPEREPVPAVAAAEAAAVEAEEQTEAAAAGGGGGGGGRAVRSAAIRGGGRKAVLHLVFPAEPFRKLLSLFVRDWPMSP